MSELNDVESSNIGDARFWIRDEALDVPDLPSLPVQCDIHRRMFDQVWEWAGRIRTRELSIGIDPYRIREDWPAALGDATYWVDNQTFSPAEVVLRLHHRTVQIHPFQNGNGRHARILAEELALGLDEDCFSWGGHLGVALEQQRAAYLNSLRRLDKNPNGIGALMKFAVDPQADDTWT
ncbi:mobile mystery protein B [Kribbella qitaiheensis]|uniref:Mobile mystery protein B n=1 Tax=Kribbella qitaiheensis TaxID=1544730 RepID=A0A7G6X6L4_9ACTN|nr:mobile mystery protein B [Kribbella qitaiheensis]QNE21879.1 mobile mystery protein B [Kribbella qitaiheensis]